MRTYIRNQILGLVSTIAEGTGQTDSLSPQVAEQVLSDCRLAIRTIEKTLCAELSEEGLQKYRPVCASLKEAADTLCSQAIQGIPGAETKNRFLEDLKCLSGLLQNEAEVRFEVAFFPYKASMWDSMESVWSAAEKDPACRTTVVPIPYYDKNPDGSLGRLHDEGGEYPSYVPVADWRAYNLAAERPDVAFIHNPYDDENIVTQVPDAYFSRNLKKYTGLLCYIPYFVVLKDLSPHFAYLPAVLNADLVFVESEKVRRQYLSVWESIVESQGSKMAEYYESVERKLIPLGSPKFDSVTNMGEGGRQIPEQWELLAAGTDGVRKKVIFYNTSIVGMLENTVGQRDAADRYLNKLESVLDFFRRRNDVVLLWRPHPLLEQTFSSMRPQLYQRYLQLVGNYRREGYGIYDDSADLHRALAFSDAYYGDGSSVVSLWKKTGKPLLRGDMDILSYHQRLAAGNLYFDGSCLWCTAFDFNGLFRIEKDSLRIHYVGQFPGEKQEGCSLFLGIAECEGKLYFAPYHAENIGVYDKEKKIFFSIPLPPVNGEHIQNGKCADAFVYGQYVFLVGCKAPVIFRIDAATNDVSVLDGWREMMLSHKNDASFSVFAFGCQDGRKLYLPSRYANAMFVFDMVDCSFEIHPFNQENRLYYCGAFEAGKVWLCSCTGSFIGIYDTRTGRTRDIDSGVSSRGGFSAVRTHKGDIYCFMKEESIILAIDPGTGQLRQLQTTGGCDAAVVADQNIYSISRKTGAIQRLDLLTLEQNTEETGCPADIPDIKCEDVLAEAEAYWEGQAWETAYLNLDLFVSIVKEAAENKTEKENCGEAIYQYVRDMIL